MSRRMQGGWLDGHPIRRARKDHPCDYRRGKSRGGRCNKLIRAGEEYVEGERNDEAGGYGADRYCMDCVRTSYDAA